MKNKDLNFWQALVWVLSIRSVYLLLGLFIMYFFKDSYKTNPIQILLDWVSTIPYIVAVFWLIKRTNTNFKDSLHIPDLSVTIDMFLITILAITIVLNPLGHLNTFFESITTSKLRIMGGTIRPWIPWLDFNMLLLGPITEELFFRGIVLKNFLKRYSPIYAILLSGLLFGIHHLNFYNLVFYITMGVLFGVIYYVTNSLTIVTLAHILNNVFTFFRYEYIKLDMENTILHLSIYTIATIWLVFLIRKSIKRVNKVSI